MSTINISLPKSMYTDVQRFVKARRYGSVSELIRDALRKILYYEDITENGFTPEFEEEVLKAAAEPRDENKVWRTQKDVDMYFSELKRKIRARKNGHS